MLNVLKVVCVLPNLLGFVYALFGFKGRRRFSIPDGWGESSPPVLSLTVIHTTAINIVSLAWPDLDHFHEIRYQKLLLKEIAPPVA